MLHGHCTGAGFALCQPPLLSCKPQTTDSAGANPLYASTPPPEPARCQPLTEGPSLCCLGPSLVHALTGRTRQTPGQHPSTGCPAEAPNTPVGQYPISHLELARNGPWQPWCIMALVCKHISTHPLINVSSLSTHSNKHKQLHDAVVSASQPQSLLQLVRHFLPSTGQFGAI
jgi:hypothetical protein